MIGAAAMASLWNNIGEAAAASSRSVRSAQLISMGGTAEQGPMPTPETTEPPPSQAFRVHDLSRRWVEHQMADSFNTPDGADVFDDSDPFAKVGVAQPLPAPIGVVVPPAAAITVPLWMRTGPAVGFAASRYVPQCSAIPYRPTGFLRPDAEFRRAGFYDLMSSIACEHGIPVGLFDAMIIRESRYRPNIYSAKNAYGLTQLMPGTAAELGVNRYHVEGNLRGGAKYLRRQLDRFGQYHLALAAYNAGPGRVRSGYVPQIRETRDYVDNVLFDWSRLNGYQRRAMVVPATTAYPPAPARTAGRTATISAF
ncbi:lytic transglycosylase domain-containing protein [Novosphingobium album (ex Liu et al. 2023)]|uniref:Lytic transglycosylase domain-containing protein n=1 Tax=Novosphingobium album (ex Liu et al. 2023) TaxID=3031130 RepID=A0ABT5WTA5_9SPHN|nr:lytic transglycosylase domain-containing protein [Novosphingobium album (ex Liu et al. 2023)]MDE8652842.1 lytic transglycosylase domain-containing protein [Novosphingobium album (ex Liu et al. 2023)]